MHRPKDIYFVFVMSMAVAFLMPLLTNSWGFGDSEYYLPMAKNPWVLFDSPWGYRIAVPYFINFFSELVGLRVESVYFLFQVFVFAGIVSLIFHWMKNGLKVSNKSAVLALLLFVFSYPGVYNLHNSSHVGLAEHFFILLGCYLAYRRLKKAFVCVLFMSFFVKENIFVFLLVMNFVFIVYRGNVKKAFLESIMLFVLALMVFVFIRSGVLFHGESNLSSYSHIYNWEWLVYVYNYWGGVSGGIARIIGTLGPIWFIAFYSLYFTRTKEKLLLIVALLACGQILLVTDIYRLVGVCAPILVVLSGVVFDRIKPTTAYWLVGVNVIYFFAFNYSFYAKATLSVGLVVVLVVLFLDRYERSIGAVDIEATRGNRP